MKKYILLTVSLFVGATLIIAGLGEYKHFKENVLGLGVVTDFSTNLASSITSSQATLPLQSVTDRGGNAITFTSSTVGDAAYFNIEPGTSRSEIVRCASLSGTTFGSCTRGLPFGANGCNNTASTTLQIAHNSGSRVVLSNVCQIYNELVSKDADQLMRGILTIQGNQLRLGSGSATTTNSVIRAFTGNNGPFIRFDQSTGRWQFSDDGTNTTNFTTSSASGLSAGKGIAFTASVVEFSPAATSTSGLGFSGGNAIIVASSTGGLVINSNGLAVSSTWFIGHGSGLLGLASTTLVLDAGNASAAANSTGFVFETGTGNQSTDLRLFIDPNDSFKLKLQAYPSASSTVTLGGTIPGLSSSTVPRSFAAGQTTFSSGGSVGNVTINHNLGIIPAWIRINATIGAYSVVDQSYASSTNSYGIWVNGTGLSTITPGANSSTYAQANGYLGGGSSSFKAQSSTSTVYLIGPSGGGSNPSRNLATGRVTNVTSSTFDLNFFQVYSSLANFDPVFITWEASY